MKYIEGNYKYQLVEDEVFYTRLRPLYIIRTEYIDLDLDGKMVIKNGYAWDGPSGPTWDTKNSIRGSLFHDAAYQLMRLELLDQKWRKVSDEELGRFLGEDGMSWLRRTSWVFQLKNFGLGAASPKNRRRVLYAP